jgi:hypothetical protein
VAERIRREVERARLDRRGVATSIGVASYPDHTAATVSPTRAAEDALCTAMHGAMAGPLSVEGP